MRMRRYILRARDIAKVALAVLVAPLTISFVSDILKGRTPPFTPAQAVVTLTLVLLYILLLFLGYTDRLDRLIISVNSSIRTRGFRTPRILIMDGTLAQDHEIPASQAHTSYSPADWEVDLKARHPQWRIELGPLERLSTHRYQVLLNPFGESYPEADPHNYTTFAVICDFVYSGGVYVNVAGWPFWYSHDPRNPLFASKLIHAGYIQRELTPAGEIITMRALFPTLFPQLGDLPDAALLDTVQTDRERSLFGDIANAGGSTKATAFRAYRPQTPGMLPLLRTVAPEMWPIAAIRYGDGCFLLAGLSLQDKAVPGFQKVIAALEGWIEYERRGRK